MYAGVVSDAFDAHSELLAESGAVRRWNGKIMTSQPLKVSSFIRERHNGQDI